MIEPIQYRVLDYLKRFIYSKFFFKEDLQNIYIADLGVKWK